MGECCPLPWLVYNETVRPSWSCLRILELDKFESSIDQAKRSWRQLKGLHVPFWLHLSFEPEEQPSRICVSRQSQETETLVCSSIDSH